MTSKTLSKADIKKINEQTRNMYSIEFFDKKDFVQLIEGPVKYVKKNKEPIFFYYEQKPVPFLKYLFQNSFLKKVTIDMGAVKFVCGGADVMRPGITGLEEGIADKEIVVIVDEKNNKPLVVGETLFSGEEIKEKDQGKVIKNLHYVSDNKWGL